MRRSEIRRSTNETNIFLSLELEGTGEHCIDTGCGFINHMLELFSRHGSFNLTIDCTSDIDVDYHHTVEDIAIVLGRAFSEALSDRRGILRYGSFVLPMDEALILAAVDISGRGVLGYELEIPREKIGDFDSELVEEFMASLSRSLGMSLHLRQLAGKNSHHIVEAAFKALARAMKTAVTIDQDNPDRIPSTKGTIL